MASTHIASKFEVTLQPLLLWRIYTRLLIFMASPHLITKVPLTMGSLVDRIEILRGDDDLQPASGQQGATNQRNVQGSRGRAGAYSRNLPFAWSSRSNRLGRRWDGDGSVLCLTPFFSSSPWEMKNVKPIFLHQTDYPSIFRHEHDRFET